MHSSLSLISHLRTTQIQAVALTTVSTAPSALSHCIKRPRYKGFVGGEKAL